MQTVTEWFRKMGRAGWQIDVLPEVVTGAALNGFRISDRQITNVRYANYIMLRALWIFDFNRQKTSMGDVVLADMQTADILFHVTAHNAELKLVCT